MQKITVRYPNCNAMLDRKKCAGSPIIRVESGFTAVL